MRLVTNDDMSDDEIFDGYGIQAACFFRINDANGRFISVRSNRYGERRAGQDRSERASTCIVKSSRYFMSFFVNYCANDAFLNVYRNGSCFLYDFFTTLVFALLFRRTRDGDYFDDDS